MTTESSTSPAADAPGSHTLNISAYKFVALDDLEKRRQSLRSKVHSLNLRGTILLSPEGINLFLAGLRSAIDEFLKFLREDPSFADLQAKESISDYQPFNRMLIKIKSEIIAFGVDGVNPIHRSSPKLAATELKKWLDAGDKVHLLDTRNDYEIEVGTFDHAIVPGIQHFRDFPAAVDRLPERMKDEPVVMFCTGGIRCEKAGPYMEQAGFQKVYQLEGGILRYFEECGGAHYNGDCFVFDQRVAVDARLGETNHTQCYVCQEVVSPDDQQSEKYVAGKSCPRCYTAPADQMALQLEERNARLQNVILPLPGSQPYFNMRPLNVPARFDGKSLVDFLTDWHPQVPREEWLARIADSRIVPGQRFGRRRRRMKSAVESVPLSPDRKVRGGERFEHLLPETTEPAVNGHIEIAFEDDQFIVVNKPAPLPLHPSGRFNRNTLQYIMDELYRPEHPLLAHRLDANTSGVLLMCRKRSVARQIQPQFENRTVGKTYLARVHGHPIDEQLDCSAPIATCPKEKGLRLIDPEGHSAETNFKVLRRLDDGTAILLVTPLTGRTNQIRLHSWHLGFPVVGDPAYLPGRKTDKNRTLSVDDAPMCLHALSLSLHDCNGEMREFSVPAPEWAEIAEC
ncbi:MAG: sulfurtransferase [Fuerstiella sp.]|jgi:RluA family pseudouridine synthase|nr:sulfurtransferase [Fuerstiella sp.]MCP4512480.1 sulfurtransferase [Fuerstiella sp.]MDG2130872.1 sulfurtransferase [Fuerstiella sp.]